MGNCCGKSSNAVVPVSSNTAAGTSMKGHPGTPVAAARSVQHAGTPNLFHVLGLEGLDVDGDVDRMRASMQASLNATAQGRSLQGMLAAAPESPTKSTPGTRRNSQLRNSQLRKSIGVNAVPGTAEMGAGTDGAVQSVGVGVGTDEEGVGTEGGGTGDAAAGMGTGTGTGMGTGTGTGTDSSVQGGPEGITDLAASVQLTGYLGTINGLNGTGGTNPDDALGPQPEQIGDTSSVKVAVLVRPLLEFEKAKGAEDILTLPGNGKVRMPAKANGAGVADALGGYGFEFDAAYRIDSDAMSRQMYAQLVLRVAERFCQGFNAAVLAYGQTGSGKTYTMGTSGPMRDVLGLSTMSATGGIDSMAASLPLAGGKPRGIIPRLIKSLFGYVEAASCAYDIQLKLQYIEIYNEQINDLLTKSRPNTPVTGVPPAANVPGGGWGKGPDAAGGGKLEIRENQAGEVYVEGATQVDVSSAMDVAVLLDAGGAVRATGGHKMNEASSRSHAIVTLTMEQRARPGEAGANIPAELRFLRSRLHLVDLAGSERVKDTGAEGARFAEGVSINKGLLELGNVINALTEGAKRRHVPYRNSKLTRVLQDSLGGTAETLMLACVSPADVNHEQTLNTLRYAQRARAIKNSLKLHNSQSPEEEIAYLRGLVARLQAENSSLTSEVGGLRAYIAQLEGRPAGTAA